MNIINQFNPKWQRYSFVRQRSQQADASCEQQAQNTKAFFNESELLYPMSPVWFHQAPVHLSHTHTWINLTPLVLHECKCIYLAICALSSTKLIQLKRKIQWETKSYTCKKNPPRWNCHGSIVSQKQTRQAHFRSILQHQAKHKEVIPGNHQFHNTANCWISVSWLNVKPLHITFFLLP